MDYAEVYAAAEWSAKWWKLAAAQGHTHAIHHLPNTLAFPFPPGTAVELVGFKAVSFNGKRGVVAEGNPAAGAW